MSVRINSYKGRRIRPVYKARIKKDEYSNAIDRICNLSLIHSAIYRYHVAINN